eukprot:2489063-Rhodomonas_salina.2
MTPPLPPPPPPPPDTPPSPLPPPALSALNSPSSRLARRLWAYPPGASRSSACSERVWRRPGSSLGPERPRSSWEGSGEWQWRSGRRRLRHVGSHVPAPPHVRAVSARERGAEGKGKGKGKG